jgi:serine protease Do
MKTKQTPAIAAILAVFALTIPTLSAAAPPETAEAPLVENIKDLKKLDRRIVAMAGPSTAATVSLVSKGGGGAGSGVIVSEEGIILTAGHVLAAMGDEIIVIFPDGTRKPAEALGADFDRDAGMARITEPGTYPHVALGSSEDLVRNDWCVALGHPGGFDPTRTPPVRLGRILRKEQFLITDTAVVGGDSGGPLFDADGNLIGIHSNIGATLMENRHVPIRVYKENWEDMKSGKRSGTRFANVAKQLELDRPVLGVRLAEEDTDADEGVRVVGTMENSPAAEAGLKTDDLITRINDKKVGSREQLIKTVSKFEPGKTITVSFRRDGNDQEVEVKLARLGDLMKIPGRGAKGGKPEAGNTPGNAGNGNKKDGDQPTPPDKDELKKRLAKAMKSGRLELTPEQLEQFGGMRKLQELLREIAKDIDPDAEVQFGSEEALADPFYLASAKAIAPVTRKAAASTFAVHLDGKPVALGTVVFEDDWVVTKDTETRGGEVTVMIDGAEIPAKLLKRYPKRDLALFRVEAAGLKPIRWRPAKRGTPVGSLLTSASADGTPLGFGLLSVQTRALEGIGFLGIAAEDGDRGVLVKSVVKGSAAMKTGVKEGDVIIAIDGNPCASALDFGLRIRNLRVDQLVDLSIRRGDEELELEATLGERKIANSSPRFRRMNAMGGALSKRITGFPKAIQHDIPLAPSECGGPLLDLNGRCVGINVSRAGRVKTLAIPAGDLRELLAGINPDDDDAKPDAKDADPGPDDRETQELLDALEKLQQQIESIEKRVRKLSAEKGADSAG